MSDKKMSPLPRGSVIGILGGGQLGRMTSMDAARLGYRSHVFSPSPDVPATDVAAKETIAQFQDTDAIERFVKSVDVVTVETEHIPAETLRAVGDRVTLYPSARCVEICQHRVVEKTFINDAGVETTRWEEVEDADQLPGAVREFGLPCIMKTATGGYDGHGQLKLETDADVKEAVANYAGRTVILEEIVDFEFEASVIVARSADGATTSYPTVRNEHRDHILWQTHAPANISPIIDEKCRNAALRIAEEMEIVGLVAVEFFVGPNDRVLVNELAPRPHNSGHWTMDGAQTPQFEQLVRAITGLPLGSTSVLHPVRMTNLLGEDIEQRDRWCRQANARIHLYGKDEIRPGRKMGHVNEIFADRD
jgi:5-(carboxyamino)imidazole ribonucleotide synthase